MSHLDDMKARETPSAEFRHFIYDPQGWGFLYFKSEEDRDAASSSVIQGYCDDGWDEEVTGVIAGEISHICGKTDVVERPEQVDEEGYDESGEYWAEEWDCKCSYALMPLLAPAQRPVSGERFQARVLPWLIECFGQVIADDTAERNHRFLEESLELVQACGCTQDEAHKLVDYVFWREVGERTQEVGGVMVTLAALCLAQNLDMHQAGEMELARITRPEMIERIREKQKGKPAMSPLPGAYPERVAQEPR